MTVVIIGCFVFFFITAFVYNKDSKRREKEVRTVCSQMNKVFVFPQKPAHEWGG